MAVTDTLTFGTLLRRYRLSAGLTQENLAERAHLSVRAISALEQGINRTPRAATLALLAEALDLSVQTRATLVAAAEQEARATRQGSAEHSPVRRSVPLLVGRSHEVALLQAHLAGDGPPLLLLAGEPGIGKSCLLAEAARYGSATGWHVLQGGCTRRGGQEPYAPFLEALDHHLQGRTHSELRAALRGCAWLVRLLPELADMPIEPLPTWPVAPEQERRLLFKAVARFLANVAGPAGTLLVLDDLQWTGPDALDLLTSLLRGSDVPLRVVGAYRDTDVEDHSPLAVALADLAHTGLARRHLLAPLTAEAVQQLVEAQLDGVVGDRTELAAQVVRRVGGIPFFAMSCVQALRRSAAMADAEAIPWDAAQDIRQRMAALPTVAQEVLSVAALVGRAVPTALLIEVVEQPEAVVLEALAAARQARLLRDMPDGYQFAHDLVREVVEDEVGQMRGRILHRHIGEALEHQAATSATEPPIALLAYHYGYSDAQEKALVYLERAGDGARDQRAHAAAVGYYRELLAQLGRLGRALDAVHVREELAKLFFIMGRYAEGQEVLEPAVAVLQRAGDIEGLGLVAAYIGYLQAWLGTWDDAIARLEPMLEPLAARGPTYSLVVLTCALGSLYLRQGRWSEVLAVSTQAIDAAGAIGDYFWRADAKVHQGTVLLYLERNEQAMPVLQQAEQHATAVSNLQSLFWALFRMSEAHEERGDLTAAAVASERAFSVAEQIDSPLLLNFARLRHSVLAFVKGQWSQARQSAESVIALDGVDTSLNAMPLLDLGRLSLAEGDWDQAACYLEQCAMLTHRRRNKFMIHAIESLRAERDLREGHPDVAVARLVPLLTREGIEVRPVTTCVMPVLAWAYLKQGAVELAGRTIGEALSRARAAGYRLSLVDILRIHALVALQQSRVAIAEQALVEGLSLARSMPYPHGEGRLLEVYGQLDQQRGAHAAARKQWLAALAIFKHLGARKDAAQVERDLAMLPVETKGAATTTAVPSAPPSAVTDAQWSRLIQLFPRSSAGRGRPRANDRRVLDAILYKQRTGCAWSAIPAILGDEVTAYRRLQQWTTDGLWERICAVLDSDPDDDAGQSNNMHA